MADAGQRIERAARDQAQQGPPADSRLRIDFTGPTAGNIGQLKVLNRAIFPIAYQVRRSTGGAWNTIAAKSGRRGTR